MTPQLELVTGLALDLAFGDPRSIPHPVRAIGALASALEPPWRRSGLPLRAAGLGFWCSVVIPVGLLAKAAPKLNPYWIWTFLALRSLDRDSMRVIESLGIEEARSRLAMIVGRDTANLDEPEIVRAVIETMAENLSDAVIAPLFYLALAGPTGMAAYKAVNTLDSMVGYRNERYADFGWASARLDDAANLIPARLTAALIWISAGLLGLDIKRSIAVTLRDAHRQPSPNSGYPEAAVAGAIGVRLGGTNYYEGRPSEKACLGDPIRTLDAGAVRKTRALLYVASALMAVAVWRLRK